MHKSKNIGNLMQILNSLETMIYAIIDSNFFLKEDIESLLILLNKLSTCSDIKNCLSLIRKLIDFVKNHAKLISLDELELSGANLNTLEKKKIQKMVNANFGDKEEKYAVETIKSFAISLIQELEDSDL